MATTTRPYNPAAYVRGGASPAVAKAIVAAGYANPGPNPIYVPTTPTYDTTPPPDDSGGGGGGGGDGGGGGAPSAPPPRAPFDFNTDPGYLAALAAEQAGGAQADAALRAAREQALVRFGDPGLAGAFGLDGVDPLTAAMAQQATSSGISTLAQLQRQRDLDQQTIVNSLAAHGLINSGDLGWRSGQNQQDYGTALYNAQQGVLDTLAQNARDTALQKQQLHTNTVNAITSAYNTYVNDPAYWGTAAPAAPNLPPPAPVTAPLSPNNRAGPAGAAPTFTSTIVTPAAPPAPTPAPITGSRTTAPVSRLATPNPYRFQTARNVRAG